MKFSIILRLDFAKELAIARDGADTNFSETPAVSAAPDTKFKESLASCVY
jgi:hypothetical protein